MFIKMYSKHLIFAGSLLAMVIGFARCSPNAAGGAGAAATTFAISGSMDLGVNAASVASIHSARAQEVDKLISSLSSGNVGSLAATQCSDNYYYKVYCVSYSEPPQTAEGNITGCEDGSGTFTVSGLPLNAEIGCFVRRSSNGSSFSTIGTLEIPTTSLSGGTTTLVSQGDLALAITLSNDGEITTTVTSGGSNIESPIDNASNVDPSQYTGIWSIQCDSSANGGTEFSLVQCKCQNGDPWSETAYNAGGAKNPVAVPQPDNREACIADNAAEITDLETQQFVEINMYTAQPQANINTGNGTIVAGTNVPVISVWAGTSSTGTTRTADFTIGGTGGEGAASSVEGVSLTWSSARATNAIAWTNSAVTVEGQTIDFSAITMPNFNGSTAAQWKSWLQNIYADYGAANFTCNWGTNSNDPAEEADAGCLAQFANEILRDNRDINIPRVNLERNCTTSGCDSLLTKARIFVEGLHIEYTSPTYDWGNDNSAATFTMDGISPHLSNRYVFEPFEATSSGGGFTQHDYWNRHYSCTSTGAGADIINAPACTGTNFNSVNCGIREETAIRFKPTSLTEMGIFFESRRNITWASLHKFSGGPSTDGTFAEALALCESKVTGEEGKFIMSATKQ